MKIEYEIISKGELTDSIRNIFANMLKEQGKVKGDLSKKADRCKFLCMVNPSSTVIGIFQQKGRAKYMILLDFDFRYVGNT